MKHDIDYMVRGDAIALLYSAAMGESRRPTGLFHRRVAAIVSQANARGARLTPKMIGDAIGEGWRAGLELEEVLAAR